MRGLIVDNFAGGGGASTGIELALGHSVDIAINHDPAAIKMHRVNHPTTKHYCENVWNVDPVEATKGLPVELAWFSPDCKHFSKAKGGKPVEKNIRGLAWIMVKWALLVKPKTLILENVEEFKTWGPIGTNGKPIESKKGETFNAFISVMTTGLSEGHPAWGEIREFLGDCFDAQRLKKGLGYKLEHRELRACDYGAPTIRKRFFIIARCDGKPIKWPEPTHGDPDRLEVRAGLLKPWKTTADIIDWRLPCPSIFLRKKSLAQNTLKRIARGINKFVINNPQPFIVRIGQTGFGKDKLQYPLEKPLTTITTKAEHLLVTPFLTSYHTETKENEVRGLSIDQPLHTLDTSNRFSLVTAFISRQFKSSINHITTVDKSSLVTAFLMKYYGTDTGQKIDSPIHTITTKDRFSLVTVKGQNYKIVDIGMRMLQPHELFAAQGFPKNYIIDHDYTGKRYPKSAQVARCGNAVPPPFAKALVEANLPELCMTNKINKVV